MMDDRNIMMIHHPSTETRDDFSQSAGTALLSSYASLLHYPQNQSYYLYICKGVTKMATLLIGMLLSSPISSLAFRSAVRNSHPALIGTSTRLGSYLDSLGSTSTTAASFHTAAPIATAAAAPPPSPSPPTTFEHVPILSLHQADAIINSAIAVCERNGFNPVTLLVLDAHGTTLVSKRMDGCSPAGVADFAFAKAYSCIVNKYPSRAFRDRYTAEPNQAAKFCQMTTMVAVSKNKMAPFPGGILLKTVADDYIIGAVGVSGAAGDEDEYCAIQGVLEAGIPGLTTEPKTHSCATVKD